MIFCAKMCQEKHAHFSLSLPSQRWKNFLQLLLLPYISISPLWQGRKNLINWVDMNHTSLPSSNLASHNSMRDKPWVLCHFHCIPKSVHVAKSTSLIQEWCHILIIMLRTHFKCDLTCSREMLKDKKSCSVGI